MSVDERGIKLTILDEIVQYKKQLLNDGYYTDKIKHIKKVDVSYKSALETTLKDEKYFGGSFERLQTLTQLTHLPVLCKDFIIDPLQIDLAKRAGASIILLIVNILTNDTLQSLYHYAISQNLEVLVEVHNKEELERAYQIKPKIIGINNRDLKTFITKVEHTNDILEMKKEGYYYISESGITTLNDVKKIVSSGIDGLLVGGALMNSNNISSLLPSLKLNKEK